MLRDAPHRANQSVGRVALKEANLPGSVLSVPHLEVLLDQPDSLLFPGASPGHPGLSNPILDLSPRDGSRLKERRKDSEDALKLLRDDRLAYPEPLSDGVLRESSRPQLKKEAPLRRKSSSDVEDLLPGTHENGIVLFLVEKHDPLRPEGLPAPMTVFFVFEVPAAPPTHSERGIPDHLESLGHKELLPILDRKR